MSSPRDVPVYPLADAERLLLASRAPQDFGVGGSSWWVIPADGSEPWFIGDGLQAEWSPSGTRIFLVSEGPNCIPRVTSMNPDGNDRTVLPFDLRNGDAEFQWSPDGRHVAFLRSAYPVTCPHQFELTYEPWLMNADGTAPHRLARYDGVVRWNPGGDRLAILCTPGIAGWDSLSIVDVAGTVVAKVEPLSDVVCGGTPAWSPDGKWLAYDRPLGSTSSIWTVDAGLADAVPLLPANAPILNVQTPTWLPDGGALLFAGQAANEPWRLWSIGSDGNGLRMVSPEPVYEREWALSPSGETIVRTGLAADGSAAIILMDLHGITSAVLIDGVDMRWQPDLRPSLDQP